MSGRFSEIEIRSGFRRRPCAVVGPDLSGRFSEIEFRSGFRRRPCALVGPDLSGRFSDSRLGADSADGHALLWVQTGLDASRIRDQERIPPMAMRSCGSRLVWTLLGFEIRSVQTSLDAQGQKTIPLREWGLQTCLDPQGRGSGALRKRCRQAARIRSLAFSAIITVGALVLPLISVGMIEASTTRKPLVPRTLSSGSTTALRSTPMRQVLTGW